MTRVKQAMKFKKRDEIGDVSICRGKNGQEKYKARQVWDIKNKRYQVFYESSDGKAGCLIRDENKGFVFERLSYLYE